VGIVIALPILVVVFPTIFAFAIGEGQSFTPLYIALACICLYAPVSWVLNGILTTYTQSAWTLAYLRLTRKPEAAEAPVFVEPNA
jgi:Cu/Ag efflux pump CusA